MMRKTLVAATVAAGLMVSTVTLAESNWTTSHTIDQIENVSNYSWVRFDGMSNYAVTGTSCHSTYGFIIDNDDGGYDMMMRVFLAAYLAGKQVQVRVEPDGGTDDPCRITRVRI